MNFTLSQMVFGIIPQILITCCLAMVANLPHPHDNSHTLSQLNVVRPEWI